MGKHLLTAAPLKQAPLKGSHLDLKGTLEIFDFNTLIFQMS